MFNEWGKRSGFKRESLKCQELNCRLTGMRKCLLTTSHIKATEPCWETRETTWDKESSALYWYVSCYDDVYVHSMQSSIAL